MFVLGWSSNFLEPESGIQTEVMQNMVTNTTHHTLNIVYYTYSQREYAAELILESMSIDENECLASSFPYTVYEIIPSDSPERNIITGLVLEITRRLV
jgi:hypothetical protein